MCPMKGNVKSRDAICRIYRKYVHSFGVTKANMHAQQSTLYSQLNIIYYMGLRDIDRY